MFCPKGRAPTVDGRTKGPVDQNFNLQHEAGGIRNNKLRP